MKSEPSRKPFADALDHNELRPCVDAARAHLPLRSDDGILQL